MTGSRPARKIQALGAGPGIICLVTNRRRLATGTPGRNTLSLLLDLIADASAAGVDLVQVREPDLPTRDLVGLVERAVEIAAGTSTRLLVNDRVDVALAAGAAGVHLKATSMPPARVRSMVPPDWLIGRSVHHADEAVTLASTDDVDYLMWGTVFETASKPGVAPSGLDALRFVTKQVSVPVLAIGGMTAARAEAVAMAGASGLAAVGAFVSSATSADRNDDAVQALTMVDLIKEMRAAFDTASASSYT